MTQEFIRDLDPIADADIIPAIKIPAQLGGIIGDSLTINQILNFILQNSELRLPIEEIINAIQASGITATDADVQELARSLTAHSTTSDFMIDSGAADFYVLGTGGAYLFPDDYQNGMAVRFIPANDNTGPATVNVAGIGIVPIILEDGSPLTSRCIRQGQIVELYYISASASFVLQKDLNQFNDLPAERFGAIGDGVNDDTLAILAGIEQVDYKISFDPSKSYLFNNYLIDATTFCGITNTGELDLTRADVWDDLSRDYIDVDGRIWSLELRHKIELVDKQHPWDCSQFLTAIESGAATVTLVGTSITEGEDAQAEAINIWANRLKRNLEESYPSVDWTFNNLGLNSRRLSDYADPNYLALAAEPGNVRDGFFRPDPVTDPLASVDTWPNGVTVGNSWQQHVADTQPDLFIIAMGMNDVTSDDVYADNLRASIAHAQSLPTVPSIALVTEMSNGQEIARHEDVKAYSRITRYIAQNNSYGLIDAGRWWQYFRRGVDEANYEAIRETDLTKWEILNNPETTSANSVSENSLTSGGFLRRGNFCGCSFSFNFTANAINSSALISAHVNGAGGFATDSITVRRFAARFDIFDRAGNVIQQITGVPQLAVGVTEDITMRIVFNRVQVWRNNILHGTYIMENVGYFGGVSVSVADGALTNIVADVAYPRRMGAPTFSDEMLVGRFTAGNWNSGNHSDGGNGINHPTRIGLSYAYQAAIDGWIQHLNGAFQARLTA